MGLLEVEFSPVVKTIMAKEPKEIEAFIRSLILCIDRQHSALNYVRWSDDARVIADKTEVELIEFLKSHLRTGGDNAEAKDAAPKEGA